MLRLAEKCCAVCVVVTTDVFASLSSAGDWTVEVPHEKVQRVASRLCGASGVGHRTG
jgi:hypothetical protein